MNTAKWRQLAASVVKWIVVVGLVLMGLLSLLVALVDSDPYFFLFGLAPLILGLLLIDPWKIRSNLPAFRSPRRLVVTAAWSGTVTGCFLVMVLAAGLTAPPPESNSVDDRGAVETQGMAPPSPPKGEVRTAANSYVPDFITIVSPTYGSTVTDETLTIRGEAPPGTEVRRSRLFRDDRIDVEPDGNWSYQVKLDEGDNEFRFHLKDDQDIELEFELVYEPLKYLTISSPDDGSTVTSSEIVIEGTAPPGTDVRHGGFFRSQTVTASDDGEWRFPAAMEHGENSFEFQLDDYRDVKVNIEVSYDGWHLTIDDPRHGDVVHEDEITIHGTATIDSDVRRSKRWRDDRISVDEDGLWQHTVSLDEGDNQFEFYLPFERDRAFEYSVTYSPWSLQIDSPSNGTITSSRKVKVFGSATPNTTVLHERDRGRTDEIRVDRHGEWEHEVRLEEGQNKLTFTLAGNSNHVTAVDIVYRPEVEPEPTPTATPSPTATPVPPPSPTPEPTMSNAEALYLAWLLDSFDDASFAMITLGEIMIEAGEHPYLIFDAEWRIEVVLLLFMLSELDRESHEKVAPARFTEIHHKWQYITWELSRSGDDLMQGIDDFDTSRIMEGDKKLQKATEEIVILVELLEAELDQLQ